MTLPRDSIKNDSPARTGGEWFLKTLQALDARYLFGTTGGGMPDIQDAMTEVRPPVWIQSLHEFPSLAAAMGYALAAEGPAFCLIDRIVGTVNALGALYAAYENYAPVIIFTSQNLPALASGKTAEGGPREYGVHFHGWQSIFPTPWTKWRYELSRLSLLPGSMLKAVDLAMTEPKGPAYMSLRQDLMATRIEAPPAPVVKSWTGQTVPDAESLALAVKLLAEARHPVIWANSMGRNRAAVPQLVALAERLGCGVVDGRNFLNFPMDHPLFLGLCKPRQKNRLLEEADVLLAIETYYDPPLTPPVGCRVIDMTNDPGAMQGGSGGDYGGSHYAPACVLRGGAAPTLRALIEAIDRGDSLSPAVVERRLQETRDIHERLLAGWAAEIQNHLEDDPVSPQRIAYELNSLWDENTIWVDGTVSGRQALSQGIFLTRPGTYFTNPSGHLGVLLGAAYGVALARPREKVIAMMGDGDFVFGNPAAVLWTCSHYRIPVLYIVFNNQCWGIEWPFIRDATLGLAAEKRNYEHVDLVPPALSFSKMAESMGVQAAVIARPGEAAAKLRWGLQTITAGEPALIEIKMAKHTSGPSSYQYTFSREGEQAG